MWREKTVRKDIKRELQREQRAEIRKGRERPHSLLKQRENGSKHVRAVEFAALYDRYIRSASKSILNRAETHIVGEKYGQFFMWPDQVEAYMKGEKGFRTKKQRMKKKRWRAQMKSAVSHWCQILFVLYLSTAGATHLAPHLWKEGWMRPVPPLLRMFGLPVIRSRWRTVRILCYEKPTTTHMTDKAWVELNRYETASL